ncbi:glycine betaine/proline transport system substrate-binding protein [Georgenia satyanarayanai]|uniref:Glycine betaine/proline transport system substrate-binding protein n=1 Tax=Georgenia satyanarayanai TaxID=860221 RepID=A0A2Y9AF97_9MICO|nr:glycine betaine ABC transporter substrate-binding protein [Georgenia satyanarayanai]PYF99379.1 glycine betaine/proline transport system substrate-binding protein [Georgenia satyanarayanai]SSA43191.1 glycine betaine/proline transport system substrate-binding protein [Georgenia satyanarayanai]
MKNTRRTGAVLASATALALTLGACGDDTADDNGTDTGATTGSDAGPITIGIHSGWEEGIAVSHLWQHILEEQGYEVEMETADAGVVFTGLAQGDYDVNFDTWLPSTHGHYLEQYGDDLEELGSWFQEAPLTIAVNEDAPIDSLAELAENADLFDNRLVGIESGAGLTKITQEQVIPTYGLEDMDYLVSSTPAMLTELRGAVDAGENVVVTLWRPHWAYDEFPIKDLEDPEGALGEPDDIYTYGTAGFSDTYPEVAEWMANFTMDDDQLHELENIMFNELEGEDNDAAVDQWVEENQEFVDSITG